jgi:hypothetical protein
VVRGVEATHLSALAGMVLAPEQEHEEQSAGDADADVAKNDGVPEHESRRVPLAIDCADQQRTPWSAAAVSADTVRTHPRLDILFDETAPFRFPKPMTAPTAVLAGWPGACVSRDVGSRGWTEWTDRNRACTIPRSCRSPKSRCSG